MDNEYRQDLDKALEGVQKQIDNRKNSPSDWAWNMGSDGKFFMADLLLKKAELLYVMEEWDHKYTDVNTDGEKTEGTSDEPPYVHYALGDRVEGVSAFQEKVWREANPSLGNRMRNCISVDGGSDAHSLESLTRRWRHDRHMEILFNGTPIGSMTRRDGDSHTITRLKDDRPDFTEWLVQNDVVADKLHAYLRLHFHMGSTHVDTATMLNPKPAVPQFIKWCHFCAKDLNFIEQHCTVCGGHEADAPALLPRINWLYDRLETINAHLRRRMHADKPIAAQHLRERHMLLDEIEGLKREGQTR